MEKLTMCRICLVENVRMHVVADSRLQEIFEKLSNISFITEDSRPMLACFFCYARLKQCYKFWQKCVEAEAVFTQMLDEENEQKPMHAELEFYGGFLKSSIDHFNIEDLSQQEDEREDKVDVKEELTGGCERMEYVEIKVECHSDAAEQETKDDSFPGFVDIPTHTQLISEDDIPLTRIKTEVEQVTKKKRATKKEREPRKKRAPAAKKPKLDMLNIKNEDTSPTKEKKNEQVSFKQPHACDVCQRNFNRKSDLKRHTLTHALTRSGEKLYKCDLCQRSFYEEGSLERHIRTHSDERPYKCNVCQSSFTQKGYLNYHIRTHTGEKPYKCEICQSSFSGRSNLRKHMRIHTGEKPHKCDTCQRSFINKSNLQSHIRTHTGEKPYKCYTCPRTFAHLGSLKVHIRVHMRTKTDLNADLNADLNV